jgi:selenoprotein W-related protein
LKQALDHLDIELIKSSGGVFEVESEGRLIYSKRRTGRFPELQEILKQLT